jgi:glycosyltransferase involved in cell wall biosynthesis
LSLFQIDLGSDPQDSPPFSFYLAEELRRQGRAFQYFVPDFSPLHLRAKDADLPVQTLHAPKEKDILASWRLARTMKQQGCRLVHVHDERFLPLVASAAARAKVPLQVASWGGADAESLPAAPKSKYFSALDLVFVKREAARVSLTKQGVDPNIIKLVPGGRDFSFLNRPGSRDLLRSEFRLSGKTTLVGVRARLSSNQTWSLLERVKSDLAKRGAHVQWILLGEGEFELGSQHAKAAQDFLFYLNKTKSLSEVIPSLDLLLVLSSKPENRPDLQAAMAAGVPLVALETQGLPQELVHLKTGLRCIRKAHEELARCLWDLLRDKELRESLTKRAREIILDKYSVESMARRMIQEYDRIARRKGLASLRPQKILGTS